MKGSGLRGQGALMLSAVFFSLTALLVKIAPSNFSGTSIAFARFVVEIILCMVIIIFTGKTFKVRGFGIWVVRGLFGAGSMILYFTAISITSSGRATLLFNTYPIFVALTGALFFHKPVGIRHFVSLVLCAGGVIWVFYDGSGYSLWGDAIGVMSGLLAGFAIHYVQKSREKNNTPLVYLGAAVFGILFTAPEALSKPYDWGGSVVILVAIGIVSLVSQLSMTYGFKYIHPTKGSIIAYSSLPLTLTASFFIGEEFSPRFILGTCLIIMGLWVNLSKKSAES